MLAPISPVTPPSPPWQFVRRSLISAASSAVGLVLAPQPALSWCAGYFPGKISNDWDEQTVLFTDGDYSTEVFVRVVSPPRRRPVGSTSAIYPQLPALPPVLIVGCPGVSYDYCENLEALAVSGRRVVLVNTCEAPVTRNWMRSETPVRGPPAMRTPAVAARQLVAVCDACGLGPSVHVFAHGLGCAAALHLSSLLQLRAVPSATDQHEVVADVTPPLQLASLTLASPYGSLTDLRPMAQRRLFDMEAMVPLDFDGSDAISISDGQQCLVDASLLTGMPWREALLRVSDTEAKAEQLGGERLAARLPKRPVAVQILTGGAADAVSPSWELQTRSDVQVREYPSSGHLPFVDVREEFLIDMLDFLDRVDGVRTSHAGISDGRG